MHPVYFNAPEWSADTNIYEINLRQYTPEGTFNAFKTHLPRLRDMGVEILWFMPITPIATEERLGTLGSYYACSDYVSTNPEYGSLEDFKQLVSAAHELGFKVIIDWVANHTGYGHTWAKANPEWYKLDAAGNFTEANGWKDVIDLDYSVSNMRSAMIAAMEFWVKACGIDGFRCDMAHLVPLDFWRAARTHLDQLKPLFWLAECEEISYHQVFDATYTWQWMVETRNFVQQRLPVQALNTVLSHYNDNYAPHALRLFFTTNHDENSWNGTEYEKYNGGAKALAVFSATWNGLPLVYSGQELPNLKRLEFFEKDTIAWTGTYGLHNFYKTLLHLRKQNPALKAGHLEVQTFRVHTNSPQHIFAYLRKNGPHQVLVFLLLSHEESLYFEVQDERIKGTYRNVFDDSIKDFDEHGWLHLQNWGYLVFEQVE